MKVIPCATKADWLAERKLGIGGSDIAALAGVSKWASPYSIWSEKRGLTFIEVEDTEQIQAGRFMEDGIARWFGSQEGLHVTPADVYYRSEGDFAVIVQSDEHTWLRATPDRIIIDEENIEHGPGLLECKNVGWYREEEWAGEDIPLYPQYQLLWGLMATGYTWGWVAGSIGGNKLVKRKVFRDPETESFLLKTGEAFWDLVRRGVAPPPDASEATRDAIKARYPSAVQGLATEVDGSLITRARELQLEIRTRDKELDLIKNRLQATLGDAEVGTCEGREVCSWRTITSPVMGKVGEKSSRRFTFKAS